MSKPLLLLAQLALAAFLPAAALATTPSMQVTLYASGATVTEQRELAADNGEIRLLLPLAAETKNLRLAINGAEVSELQFRKVPAPKNWENEALRASIREAESRVAGLEGEQKALETRLAFWREPKPRLNSLQDMERFDARLAERLVALHREAETLKEPLELARAELARLKARQASRGGESEAYELTARLAFGKTPPKGPLAASLTYHLKDCGWKPMMRLDAFTGKNTVELTRLAVIEQKTGQDWSRAQLTLSTITPTSRLMPPALSRWHIGARPMPAKLGRSAASDMMAAETAMMAMPAELSEPENKAPEFSEQTSSGIWALGTRDIPAGEPVLVTLDSQNWKADFYRLLRPSVADVAYLEAHVTPPSPITIPAGTAQYLVDGAMVGSRTFSFSGSEGKIGFGPDPAVTAKMTADATQSGSKGFIGKRNTYDWRWTIVVSNAHKTAVKARVEDPKPQAMDKAIEIAVSSTPPAKIDGHSFVWELSIPAGGKETILHSVSFSAPEDLKASPGR